MVNDFLVDGKFVLFFFFFFLFHHLYLDHRIKNSVLFSDDIAFLKIMTNYNFNLGLQNIAYLL